MNKDVAKTVMAAAGVPVPKGRVVHRLEAAKAHALPPPYVLKPVFGGLVLRRVHRQGRTRRIRRRS